MNKVPVRVYQGLFALEKEKLKSFPLPGFEPGFPSVTKRNNLL